MKTVGIVCEYNPFHNGHLSQFRHIRACCGTDAAIVCLMSGNYVQRGAPAIMDKSIRAQAALLCGADLVLELPPEISLSSAEGFAAGGVAHCLPLLRCPLLRHRIHGQRSAAANRPGALRPGISPAAAAGAYLRLLLPGCPQPSSGANGHSLDAVHPQRPSGCRVHQGYFAAGQRHGTHAHFSGGQLSRHRPLHRCSLRHRRAAANEFRRQLGVCRSPASGGAVPKCHAAHPGSRRKSHSRSAAHHDGGGFCGAALWL